MATETVLIDFQVDYTELTTAQEQLAKSGKIDVTGFTALNKSISKTATDTKGLIGEFKKVATTATQMGKSVENAFASGVQDALDEAGVSAEEFAAALTKANTPVKSLKTELKELKEAIALAKVNGQDFGEEFDRLTQRAGALSDAIADAGAEIKNAGSDTRVFDNIAGSVSALAGGFSAVQGAAALFGDESEDLQKALLKVNAAMALATGLQQVQTAVQKEGSLAKLADSIATGTQTAATKLYTFVTGGATVATKVFRAALVATGIGAIVVLLVSAYNAMKDFGESTKTTNADLKQFSESVDASADSLDRFINSQNNANDLAIEKAKQRGATEAEINKMVVDGMRSNADETAKIVKGSLGQLNKLADEVNTQIGSSINIAANEYERFTNRGATAYNILSRIKDLKISGEFDKLSTSAKESVNNLEEVASKINDLSAASQQTRADATLKEEQFRTKVIEDAAKKREELRKKSDQSEKDRLAKERERILAGLNDQLAALELQLLAVEKNSQAEVDIKKAIVTQKAAIELQGEKLTANQIKLIKANRLNDELELQKEFNRKATEEQLKSQIISNETALVGVGITNEKRLQLQIENINTAAQLEINAAEGNATKILMIEAKKLADIRALKNAAIDRELQEQVASSQRSNDIVKTGLLKLVSNVKEAAAVRRAASEGIERQELSAVDAAIRANDKKEQSDQDYQAKNKELLDQRAQAQQEHSDRVVEIDKSEKAQLKENAIALAEISINILGQAADFASQLNQLAADQDAANIERQKRELAELEEAGAISIKNAEIRAKQIEIQERAAKNRQAQREKQVAVFNALLAIPQAYLAGLKSGPQGLVLGPIFALIAAAQAALVIARPVPKFFRGKQPGTHEGKGVVADMGSEIVERNGRMFLYTKPTETYLSKMDKVYTAGETRKILHNTNINTSVAAEKQERIDYKKLGQAIPQSSFSVNIDKDFIEESVSNGLMKNKYFNKRYNF